MNSRLIVLTLLLLFCSLTLSCEECESKLESTLFKALLNESDAQMVEFQNEELRTICRRLHPPGSIQLEECLETIPILWPRLTKHLFELKNIYEIICQRVGEECQFWTDWKPEQCFKCKTALNNFVDILDDATVVPSLLEFASGLDLCGDLCDSDMDEEECRTWCDDLLETHLDYTFNTFMSQLGQVGPFLCQGIFGIQGC